MGIKSIQVTVQEIQEQYHIILNINKMDPNHYTHKQVSEIRMNVINRIYQYVKYGKQCYLTSTGDPVAEHKHNLIIEKLEQLKQNNYSKTIEKILDYTSWNEHYQTEIKTIFDQNTASKIIKQLKKNINNNAAMEQILPTLRTYNISNNLRRYSKAETAHEEIISIIHKLSAYQQALTLSAEYPSIENINKINGLVKQRCKDLGQQPTKDLMKICLLKDCVLFTEGKLKGFLGNYIRGEFDQKLTDKIRQPLQKLLKSHQYILQSLKRFGPTTNSIKTNGDDLKVDEVAISDQISNLDKIAQEILRGFNVPIEYCSRGTQIQNKIANLSSKIDSMGQIINHYNAFIEDIEDLSVRNMHKKRINNKQTFPHQKPIWTRRLDNILERLKTQEISSNTKDLQERTVLLKRWQALWRQMGLEDKFQNNLDRHQYPKKGQADVPLQIICDQIAILQRYHQECPILEKNKQLSNQQIARRQMTEDEQFLASNPNLRQEFHRDKETIRHMSLNEMQYKLKIQNQDAQLQTLRFSQKQMGSLLDRLQAKLNTIKQIQRPDIRGTREGQLMGALNYLQQIFDQNGKNIRQISDENSSIKKQNYELETQIKQITAQKKIAELQAMKSIAYYKRRQQDSTQKANKTAMKVSQLTYSSQILLNQKQSLSKDYLEKIKSLQKVNKQIVFKDKRIQQLQSKIGSLQRNVKQDNQRLEFSTVLNIQEQISRQEVQLKLQFIFNHYTKWIAQLQETIKEKFIRYESILKQLERQAIYISKIREDVKRDKKLLQVLKEELSKSKRKCQQLSNSLKAGLKNDQQAKVLKQTISKDQAVIATLKKKVEDLNAEVKRQKSAIADLEISLQGAQSDKKDLEMEVEGLKMQFSMAPELSPENCKLNHGQMEQQQKIFETQIRYLTEQLNKKSKDLSQLSSRLTQSRVEIMRQEGEAQTYKSELKKKNEMIEKLKVTSSANVNPHVRNPPNKKIDQDEIRQTIFKELSIKYQSQFVARKKRLMKIYATKYSKSAQQSNLGEMREIYLACTDNFFQGELLNQHIDYKYRLAYHLETFAGVPILRTKLIYTFDLKNKTNFHLYIDGVTSLLFIVKTVTGLFLAGYYSGKYLQGPMMDPGLLISISNNDSFRLNVPDHNSKNSYRCMVYDPYFLIFGNAQIRIKTGQKELFSNFGIMNSYFNTSNKKLKDFIGFEDKRQVEIESYEMYEVLFNYEFYDD